MSDTTQPQRRGYADRLRAMSDEEYAEECRRVCRGQVGRREHTYAYLTCWYESAESPGRLAAWGRALAEAREERRAVQRGNALALARLKGG